LQAIEIGGEGTLELRVVRPELEGARHARVERRFEERVFEPSMLGGREPFAVVDITSRRREGALAVGDLRMELALRSWLEQDPPTSDDALVRRRQERPIEDRGARAASAR